MGAGWKFQPSNQAFLATSLHLLKLYRGPWPLVISLTYKDTYHSQISGVLEALVSGSETKCCNRGSLLPLPLRKL